MQISRQSLTLVLSLAYLPNLGAQQPQILVRHYTIKAEIIPSEHRLVSEAEMLVKNLGPVAAEKLQFRLRCDRVRWTKDAGGRDMAYRAENGIVEIDFKLLPSDSAFLTISYEGRYYENVSNRIEEQNSWLLFESEWYPQLAVESQFSNWFTYDLYITVPADQMGISGGKLQSTMEEDGKRKFHWAVRDLQTQHISLISGAYEKQEFKGGQHPVTTYFFVQKGSDDSARQVVRDSPDQIAALLGTMISFYSKEFGEYPFDDFKIVETNRRGGYGDRGLVLLNSSAIKSSFEDFQSFFGAFTLSHELAHQWWGNQVGHNLSVKGEEFFQEAITQYSAWRYWQQQDMTTNRKLSTRITAVPIVGPVEISFTPLEWEFMGYSKLYDYRPVSAISPGERDFSRAAHFKGVYFLKALKSTVGSELMKQGLREYLERFKFKTASLADFKRTMQEVSGKSLDELFRDWLHSTKRVDYAISDLKCTKLEEGKYTTKISLSNLGNLSVPLEVVARTRSGKEISVLYDERKRSGESQDILTDEEVVSAVVDPDWDLLDINRTNNYLPGKVEYHFLIFDTFPHCAAAFLRPLLRIWSHRWCTARRVDDEQVSAGESQEDSSFLRMARCRLLWDQEQATGLFARP